MDSRTPAGQSIAGAGPGGDSQDPAHEPGENWRKALMTLIASRIGIFRIESRQAARVTTRRSLLFVTAFLCLLFAWALLLCAAVLWLPQQTGLPLPAVALLLGIAHLVGGAILVLIARRNTDPLFPTTRSEFLKDRAWLENLQKNQNS